MTSEAAIADHSSGKPADADLAWLRSRLADAERERDRLREALRDANARERGLSDDLQHRVRNMLAVIRSILRRSWETGASQAEFVEHFEGRLDALAHYQSDWRDLRSAGVELEDVIRDQLLSVHCADGDRLTIVGPPVFLGGKTLELMVLAVHELTTNSIKFGALSGNGRLNLAWAVTGPPDATTLAFDWSENGVAPLVPAPRSRGFGRQFIEEALPYQLGAETSFALRPGGIECSISLPLSGLLAQEVTIGRTEEQMLLSVEEKRS